MFLLVPVESFWIPNQLKNRSGTEASKSVPVVPFIPAVRPVLQNRGWPLQYLRQLHWEKGGSSSGNTALSE